MPDRFIDPPLLTSPLALEWPEGDDRKLALRAGGSRKRRASSVSALLAMLVAALVLVPATQSQPGPNIVVNGDFEAPVVCPAPFLTVPPAGWTLEQGTVDLVCTFWQPASGFQSVDMTGTPGQGTLSQNLATVAGEQYRLRFAMAGNPDPACGPAGLNEPAQKVMEVWWGGALVTTLTFDTTGHTFASMGWIYHTFTLEATGTSTELQFTSRTGTFCGPTLDDVSVQQLDDDDGDDGDDDDGDDGDDDGDDNGDDDGDDNGDG
jgi:choice-of-anchor C domain-containing protein